MSTHTRSGRRLAAAALALALAAASLTACGGDDEDAAGATSGTGDPAASQPATTGGSWDGVQDTEHTLTVAFATGWTSVDPVNNTAGVRDLSIVRSVYSALTQTDENADVHPDVATDWERTADNEWTFTLRDDVNFPNGEPLDAENVKYNIERTLNEAENPSNWITSSISNITEVKVVEPYKVAIVTQAADLELPRRLSGVFLVSKTFAADHDLKKEALGTGPYNLVSFKPDSEVVFEAKDNYHGGVVPFKHARFILAADAAAKINGLKAGEIDAANIIDPADFAQLESADVVVGAEPSARVMLLLFNTYVEELKDVRVRQAISYGIDREAITQAFYKGLVGPAQSQMIYDVYDAHNEDLPVAQYDPEKSKALLAEAGYGDGITLELLATQHASIASDEILQVIAQQLGEVGITIDLQLVPRSVASERDASKEVAPAIRYGGFIDTAVVAAETLRYIGSTHHQSFTDVPAGYDDAVAAARAANSEDEKIAKIKEATQLSLDNQQAVFLWPLPQTFARSADIDWPIRADDYLLPYTMTPAS
ncbi:MAG: ABC transporter substrate-binding protein [Propionibacteriaceae bacterium]|jgi:peptide/nickel transport system substrate-binding protein|nr:ABC transporter substrate-binding protein [Propionibacteriaceae bacterium]